MNAFLFERELAIAEKAFDTGMAEANYLNAVVESKLMINLANSELKVMTEATDPNGAVKDLLYLFNEAEKEAKGEKEGVVRKIGRVLSEFVTKVWNSIQKVFTGHDTAAYEEMRKSNAKVEHDFSMTELFNSINEKIPKSFTWAGIAAAVAGGGGLIAFFSSIISKKHPAFNKKETTTASKTIGCMDKIKGWIDNIKGFFGKGEAEPSKDDLSKVTKDDDGKELKSDEEKKGRLSKVVETVTGALSRIYNWLNSKLPWKKKNLDENGNEVEDEGQDGKSDGKEKSDDQGGNDQGGEKKSEGQKDGKSSDSDGNKEPSDDNKENILFMKKLDEYKKKNPENADADIALFKRLRSRFLKDREGFAKNNPNSYQKFLDLARKIAGNSLLKYYDVPSVKETKESVGEEEFSRLEKLDIYLEKSINLYLGV